MNDVASFERASLQALLAKSRGAPYEEALKKIIALKLEQQQQQPPPPPPPHHHHHHLHHLHHVPPPPLPTSTPAATTTTSRSSSPSPSHNTHTDFYGGGGTRGRSASSSSSARGRSQSPSSHSTTSRTSSRTTSRRRSSSAGSNSSASRYLRSSSNESYGYNKGLAARSIAYDDKWAARSTRAAGGAGAAAVSPPRWPFEPTLMSRASSEKILRANRGNETFQQRVSRSVHNYYIRQAFSCFANDGPGQYTKQVTLPYHQRHGKPGLPRHAPAQGQSPSAGGGAADHTFGTERYNDSFMARTFAHQSHAAHHTEEPAPGQYAPPNTHSKLFHSREYGHPGPGHGLTPGGLHISTDAGDADAYYYGPHHTSRGHPNSQPSSVRTTHPSPDLRGASPSSRGSRGSVQSASTERINPHLSPKEHRLRHLLRLISEHS